SQHLHPTSEPVASQADIAALAQQYVLNLFNQKNDPRLVFHTYRQTTEIAKTVNSLAEANGSTEGDWKTAGLAAWFINAGFLFDYQDPVPKSLELAGKFFEAHQFSPGKKKIILTVLEATILWEPPKSPAAQLLLDAVRAVHFGEDFFDTSSWLRTERELLLNLQYSKEEWEQYQIQQLLNARFYTAHAKITFEPVAAGHLVVLKDRLEKQRAKRTKKEEPEDARKQRDLERRISSGTQTFFRTNYRNHINLSSIADNKAHIMISVNAILISVIISVISYRNMTETNPAILMPAIIFVVTGLSSLIFAVLAARPKVTSLIHEGTPLDEAKRNIVFFGNFVSLKMEKYEELMEEMFNDSKLLYGNMTRDLYNLGKVLDKKYRYLSISYNIFMVGFAATVLTFLLALLF
ncbi:MAG: Pycsar system effector family protein, partial [Saprospiraceae bacterium]